MILVAGATGYTGRRIVAKLIAAGEGVRCLVRATSDGSALDRAADRVMGDLQVGDVPPEAFDGVKAVVSAAHIRFAPGLVRAGSESGVRRFVLFSSTWRFSRVVTADTIAVVHGEEGAEAVGAETTLLRPTMIYGPGDDRNVSRLRAHMNGSRIMPVLGGGERLVQPVHVDDVADAAVQALWRSGAAGRAYTLAGGSTLTYSEMLDAIGRITGRTVLKVYVPLAVAVPLLKLYGAIVSEPRVTVDQARRMAEDRAFDIEEARQDLGFQPRGFEEGLRGVVEEEAGER